MLHMCTCVEVVGSVCVRVCVCIRVRHLYSFVGARKHVHTIYNVVITLLDIKPSNMLVNTQGHVKLCDFGISVQLLTSLTKTYIGTNAYMAVSVIV